MASEDILKRDDPDAVLLLFGPSRSGKSSTGNLILRTKTLSANETMKCVAAQETIGGQKIRVIDTTPTPDYCDEPDTILHENREITRSLLLSATGPRNIVVVVKKDQKPKQIAGCIQFLQMMLGKDAMKDLIILFTGTSDVSDSAFNTFLRKLADKYPDERRILDDCRQKRLAFNDGDSAKDNQQKVTRLLRMAKMTTEGDREIQLVMIGQSYGGKSKAANNILGEEVFMSGSETLGCTVARRNVNGKGIMVVDTPGLYSRVMENDAILSELKDPAIALAAPSRIFALVMRMDREELTDEEKNLITILQDQFRDKIAEKLVIIFTRQEEYLRRMNSSFEQFLRNTPPVLKKLLKQCHYRCKGFNNMAMIDGQKEENTKQVDLLLQLVDKADADDSKLRLVLIGRTGMGKSCTGNTILGRPNVFEHATSMVSNTRECKRAQGCIGGRLVEVVDTPGLFDTRPQNTATVTLMEMARCLTMTIPGPHAFLLVIAISEKFTQEQQKCLDILRMTFGEKMFRHTVVIFTKADHLDRDQSTEEIIRTSGSGLRDILRQNNHRWLAFNNKEPTGDEPEKLLETVELMLACNEGRHYTSTMYTQVVARLQAYGAGNVAEMRALIDENPRALLGIMFILMSTPAFGFGFLMAAITVVCILFTLLYEHVMGRVNRGGR